MVKRCTRAGITLREDIYGEKTHTDRRHNLKGDTDGTGTYTKKEHTQSGDIHRGVKYTW